MSFVTHRPTVGVTVHEAKIGVHRPTSFFRMYRLYCKRFFHSLPVQCNSLRREATPSKLLASKSRFVRATKKYEGLFGVYGNNEDICKHFHSCFKMATRIQVNLVAWRNQLCCVDTRVGYCRTRSATVHMLVREDGAWDHIPIKTVDVLEQVTLCTHMQHSVIHTGCRQRAVVAMQYTKIAVKKITDTIAGMRTDNLQSSMKQKELQRRTRTVYWF